MARTRKPDPPIDELDAARAALAELEDRLAREEPVSRAERRAVNDAYRAASNAAEARATAARTAENAARGETGEAQTIGEAR